MKLFGVCPAELQSRINKTMLAEWETDRTATHGKDPEIHFSTPKKKRKRRPRTPVTPVRTTPQVQQGTPFSTPVKGGKREATPVKGKQTVLSINIPTPPRGFFSREASPATDASAVSEPVTPKDVTPSATKAESPALTDTPSQSPTGSPGRESTPEYVPPIALERKGIQSYASTTNYARDTALRQTDSWIQNHRDTLDPQQEDDAKNFYVQAIKQAYAKGDEGHESIVRRVRKETLERFKKKSEPKAKPQETREWRKGESYTDFMGRQTEPAKRARGKKKAKQEEKRPLTSSDEESGQTSSAGEEEEQFYDAEIQEEPGEEQEMAVQGLPNIPPDVQMPHSNLMYIPKSTRIFDTGNQGTFHTQWLTKGGLRQKVAIAGGYLLIRPKTVKIVVRKKSYATRRELATYISGRFPLGGNIDKQSYTLDQLLNKIYRLLPGTVTVTY